MILDDFLTKSRQETLHTYYWCYVTVTVWSVNQIAQFSTITAWFTVSFYSRMPQKANHIPTVARFYAVLHRFFPPIF